MPVADNEIAKEYERLQCLIDWETTSNLTQIKVMEKMKTLLISAKYNTPIFKFSNTSIRTASEQFDNIVRRIERLKSKL